MSTIPSPGQVTLLYQSFGLDIFFKSSHYIYMENNQPVQAQAPVNPILQQPPVQPVFSSPVQNSVSSAPKGGMGKRILLLVVIVLLLLSIVGGGYYLFLNSNKSKNANVYIQPTTAVTPTPQAYQSNPKDTSDQAITNDSAAANQSLNNIDSSLNSVDQGLNDQQTNLQ